jgi:low affinity Fe/Cu permease
VWFIAGYIGARRQRGKEMGMALAFRVQLPGSCYLSGIERADEGDVERSKLRGHIGKTFARFATFVARTTGRPVTFILCVAIILIWAISGPIFHFSDTWQLVINTGTTIVTFLQVFLIQNTQNRDGAAIQAKLDELIRVSAARNQFMGVEDLTQDELETLRDQNQGRRAQRLEQAQEAADRAVERAGEDAAKAAREAKPTFR